MSTLAAQQPGPGTAGTPAVVVRKRAVTVETVWHDGGPVAETPVRYASALAVVANPFAGRYEADLLAFQSALRGLGHELATELVGLLGRDRVQVYGKGALVGVAGELEHAAVWHEAGGWAMRSVLGDPKAIVPSNKAVASAGYRLLVPVHHIEAAYVRSHFASVEVGVQDGPRPHELLFALVMGTGPRVHERIGGLRADQISVHDGQR
ncbi:amino acid synthesis family protein [Geodermatophilus sp. SYSU D01036]